jgi:hypothetical protein
MELDRRELVRASAAGLALFALPGMFAARARAERGQVAGTEVERAKTRFLLVLHADAEARRRAELGECFGSFLLNAEAAQLAPLAVCDITCASTEEFPGLPWKGAPVHAVLIEPVGKVQLALVGDLARSKHVSGAALSPGTRLQDAWRHVHALIAAQLARVIPSGEDALLAWAEQERIELGPLPNPTLVRLESAQRWPWQARRLALEDRKRRDAWLYALADSVRERWERHAPAGAVWGNRGGCGVTFQGPPELVQRGGGPCGTGMVPEESARFLHFYRAEELADFVGPPPPK